MLNRKDNQIKAGIVLAYIATGLRVVIQLIYTPFLLRLLGKSEYGLYTLVASVVGYLGLLNLGFGSSYVHFYAVFKKEDRDTASLNGTFIKVFLSMSLVALVSGWTLSQNPLLLYGNKLSIDQLHRASIMTKILVINIALAFPSSLFESIITSHEEFIFNRLVRIMTVVFDPFLGLMLLLTGHGSIELTIATTIVNALKLLVDFLFCKHKLHTRFDLKAFDMSLIKEVSRFSFFIFLTVIIERVNWSVDKYILGRISGTEAVAIYSVGALVNSMFVSFSSTVHSAFIPRVNRIAADYTTDNNKAFTELFVRIGRIQFQLLMLFATGFIIFGRFFIVNIYATESYSDAYLVAMLLFIPNLIQLTQNIGIEIQRALNRHQILTVFYSFMSVLNILISIPLASRYGPIGSALGTTISVLIGNGLIANIYYYKALNINVADYWRSIICMAKGLIIPIVFGSLYAMLFLTNKWQFVLGVMLYSLIYCISVWKYSMNDYERGKLGQILHRLK